MAPASRFTMMMLRFLLLSSFCLPVLSARTMLLTYAVPVNQAQSVSISLAQGIEPQVHGMTSQIIIYPDAQRTGVQIKISKLNGEFNVKLAALPTSISSTQITQSMTNLVVSGLRMMHTTFIVPDFTVQELLFGPGGQADMAHGVFFDIWKEVRYVLAADINDLCFRLAARIARIPTNLLPTGLQLLYKGYRTTLNTFPQLRPQPYRSFVSMQGENGHVGYLQVGIYGDLQLANPSDAEPLPITWRQNLPGPLIDPPPMVPQAAPIPPEARLRPSVPLSPADWEAIGAAVTLMDICQPGWQSQARLLRRGGDCLTASQASLKAVQPDAIAETRVQGISRYFATYGSRAIVAASAIGAILLPAFLILDFINGDWAACGWTLGSVAAGIAADVVTASIFADTILAGFAVAGPIGLIIGAAIGVFFSIIPGLFNTITPPPSNNITQIIQYAFFGDPSHTGNEGCNKQLSDNGQTPNCTVIYGSGTIAGMFDWEPFDAAAFASYMNDGLAMSIPDSKYSYLTESAILIFVVAANFTVLDPFNPGNAVNAIATIDCGRPQCQNTTAPQVGGISGPAAAATRPDCYTISSKPWPCANPKFKLNRDLLVLPTINRTASDVHTAVQNGECKIVSDPIEGQTLYDPGSNGTIPQTNLTLSSDDSLMMYLNDTLQALNLTSDPTNVSASNATDIQDLLGMFNASTSDPGNTTLTESSSLPGTWSILPSTPFNFTGMPVAFACNLTAQIPDVLSPDYNYTRNIAMQNPNTTTANVVAYVQPPAPSDFVALTSSNSVCLSSSKSPSQQLCLPDGTFPTCQGGFGLSTANVDTLTSSTPNTNITITFEIRLDSNGDDITPTSEFDAPVSASGDLLNSFKTATSAKSEFTISSPSDSTSVPSMCLYSGINYEGDVYCMGLGGTNFSSSLVNKAASISLSPGLEAWIYPAYYGNPLGTFISLSVANLTSIPYNTTGSFNQNVAAAWILEANGAKKASNVTRRASTHEQEEAAEPRKRDYRLVPRSNLWDPR